MNPSRNSAYGIYSDLADTVIPEAREATTETGFFSRFQ